jgi:hypothetical protein
MQASTASGCGSTIVDPSIAVARLSVVLGRHAQGLTRMVELRMAVNGSSAATLAGRLVGAFDPESFAYEVGAWIDLGEARAGRRQQSEGSMPFVATVPCVDGSFRLPTAALSGNAIVYVDASMLTESQSVTYCQPLHFPFRECKLGPSGDIELSVPRFARLQLRDRSEESNAVAGADVIYRVWGEKYKGPQLWYKGSRPATGLLPVGTYVVQAVTDRYASPLTVVRLDEDIATLIEIDLQLARCPRMSFSIEEQGGPIRNQFLRIGNEAMSVLDDPRRVSVFCEDGIVEITHLLAGTYYIEYVDHNGQARVSKQVLSPDTARIALDVD